MSFVMVLTAAPGSGAITDGLLRLVGGNPHWLAAAEAAEFAPPADVSRLRQELAHLPIDINLVPLENRRKRLLIADMDSTMIEQECIDELGEAAGVGERIKAITIRAMRDEIEFEAALLERLALLAGLPATAIDAILQDKITLKPGGKALVSTMKAHGAFTALVSGGFRQFTSRVAALLGFDTHEANDLVIEQGKLTGHVTLPVLGRLAKVAALQRLTSAHGLTAADALAVGDGANDIPMLQAAGLGVALHAKPKTRQAAACQINHGDLTALLYLQGYRREDFA